MIRLKRAYAPRSRSDGYRVLVERLWPRGLSKEDAHLDAWLKELAPTEGLRKWFGHDPARFAKFSERYEKELEDDEAQELLDGLAERAGRGTITLVYAAKDEEHNSAVVLARELERRSLYHSRRARRQPGRYTPRSAHTVRGERGVPRRRRVLRREHRRARA
jgi:uncharacterized protein YeaO (DUF488 family)